MGVREVSSLVLTSGLVVLLEGRRPALTTTPRARWPSRCAARPTPTKPSRACCATSSPAGIDSTPDELRDRLRRIVESNPTAVTPAAAAWSSDGIESLAPDSPAIKALSVSAFADGVVLHSILDHGRSGTPGPGSSDGVVPYWSAHLDEAVSEVRVLSNHIVHEHPTAVAEVKRILREHLREGTPTRRR